VLLRKLRTNMSSGNWTAFYELAVPLENSLDPMWLRTRKLKWANRVLSVSDASKAISHTGARFDALIARTLRSRNIQVHGGAHIEASSQSCAQFIKTLGRVVFDAYVETVALGDDPLNFMNELATHSAGQIDKIRIGQFPSTVSK
jgi:hypothetical protein